MGEERKEIPKKARKQESKSKRCYENNFLLEHDKVYIANSSIAGRGVFAKRKIKRGEEVCFYDGDIYEQKAEGPFHYFSKDKRTNLDKN